MGTTGNDVNDLGSDPGVVLECTKKWMTSRKKELWLSIMLVMNV